MIYLDSSAIVKLLAEEPESRALRAELDRRGGRLVASVLAATEVSRALHARGAPTLAQRVIDVDGARLRIAGGVIALVPLDVSTAAEAGRLEPGVSVRSLDAIHVATATRILHLSAFVTYDRRMAAAATTAGLAVLAPAA